ncbi:MAG: HIT domain-containing protein [Desulfobacterota bacterium]|nr:HIT domain-containing protein [Thermodesulfobacteriota bacterium]
MKVLWAPWRMEYILNNDKEPGCIFCPPGKDNLKERLILHWGASTLVLMNKYPYNNGHLLVAPVRHIPSLDTLSSREMANLLGMVRQAVAILKQVFNPEGFNVGLNLGRVAGAGIADHLHFHIVPRWNGDTNFMAVVGDLRVIPEHLDQTFERLSGYFQEVREDQG